MLDEYVSLVYEDERNKIPYLFRMRENTDGLVKMLIIGIVAVAAVAGLFFCFGGRGMGELVIRVSCMRWRITYPQVSFTIIIIAAVLILLIIGWYRAAVWLRRRADKIARERVMPMIEYDNALGNQRARANEYDVKIKNDRKFRYDYEDELDLSDITIPPLQDN
ncbi:MAG: hypothetical protein J6X33_01755 [Clostridiales bacterium]|nr:hypothetical protein [Clostridiales bacterium]